LAGASGPSSVPRRYHRGTRPLVWIHRLAVPTLRRPRPDSRLGRHVVESRHRCGPRADRSTIDSQALNRSQVLAALPALPGPPRRFRPRSTPTARKSVVRLVLDTNAALSGLLWHGNPGKLIDAAQAGSLILCASAPLLAELHGVLGREKFATHLQARGMTAIQ